MLFICLLGGVVEEMRKENVEGVSVVVVVDDLDFIVVGRSEREMRKA